MIALLVCLKYYYSFVNMNFYFESFGSEHSCHNKENYIENYARLHSTSKILFFYHLPTRERAGIKLGDADTSPMYL